MNEQAPWLPIGKNIEDYQLLKDMLHSQKKEFSLLSSKKADVQLNTMKIKMVNRVLEPLNEIFKNEESHKFLDTLSEDEMPTNSDVVLIFSQYETAINEFKSKYFRYDEYLERKRWMTEECPPDFYENEEGEEGDGDYDELEEDYESDDNEEDE